MTQDEIIEMADKCGLMGYFELDGDSVGQLGIEAFAKLIAEKAFKDGYAIGEAAGFKQAIKLELARGKA